MKKGLLLYVLLTGLLFAGCADEEKNLPKEAEGDKTISLKPTIDVVVDGNGAWAYYDKYCWEDADKQCSLEPTLPSEFLEREQVNHIIPGEDIRFRFSIPLEDLNFPEPDSFIAYIQEGDEMKPIEVNDQMIQAPQTPGKHYMSVKAIWDGDVKGEAIYAFSVFIKE